MFSIVGTLVDFLVLGVLNLGIPLHLFGCLAELCLDLLAALTLGFVGLLILYDFSLTFVNNLQEEVLHETHCFLVLLCRLNTHVSIVADTNPLELLFQRLGVLKYVLDLVEPLL
jgi:hypothetical protein